MAKNLFGFFCCWLLIGKGNALETKNAYEEKVTARIYAGILVDPGSEKLTTVIGNKLSGFARKAAQLQMPSLCATEIGVAVGELLKSQAKPTGKPTTGKPPADAVPKQELFDLIVKSAVVSPSESLLSYLPQLMKQVDAVLGRAVFCRNQYQMFVKEMKTDECDINRILDMRDSINVDYQNRSHWGVSETHNLKKLLEKSPDYLGGLEPIIDDVYEHASTKCHLLTSNFRNIKSILDDPECISKLDLIYRVKSATDDFARQKQEVGGILSDMTGLTFYYNNLKGLTDPHVTAAMSKPCDFKAINPLADVYDWAQEILDQMKFCEETEKNASILTQQAINYMTQMKPYIRKHYGMS